jgi:hypothetical protein
MPDACRWMPASRIPRTNGAAEPSRIGTSGPSISIKALWMPHPAKSGHDMFDGRDGRAAIAVQPRAQAALRDEVIARGDQRRAGQVHAAEPQAHIRGMGADRHPREPAGVKPYAAETHVRSDRGLHVETVVPFVPAPRPTGVSAPGRRPWPSRLTPRDLSGEASVRSARAVSFNYGLLGWAGNKQFNDYDRLQQCLAISAETCRLAPIRRLSP